MAKGIYERKGLNGDVTYYIGYQVDGTDIKEAGGQEVPGIYPRDGQGCSQDEVWGDRPGRFNLEKARKPVPFSKLAERYREFAGGYKRGGKLRNTL
jgi:hypothetical protein